MAPAHRHKLSRLSLFTTSVWQEKGYEVCAYIADLGQDDVLTDEQVQAISEKAETSGA
jgi:argininosuccinate synthase